MNIFCCLTINAVFQSNYLSLLQPLLSQRMALRPAGIQNPNKNEVWIRCTLSGPFPLLFTKILDAFSPKEFYNGILKQRHHIYFNVILV